MRPDVHQAKLNAQKNIQDSGRILTPEQELLVERSILDGKRAGADLDEKKRNELMELRVELTTLENKFNVSFVSDSLNCSLKVHGRETSRMRMHVLNHRLFVGRLTSALQPGAYQFYSPGARGSP